jgi:hypothetical protein
VRKLLAPVPHVEEILKKPQRFGEPALISRIGS